MVITLATPIADLLGGARFANLTAPLPVALLLILGASFLFGLALRSRALTRLGHWIEEHTVGRLPMYSALKRLSLGFSAAEQGRGICSVLLTSPDGTVELVYVVEKHNDGRSTVLVPWAPASFAGSVKIVPSDRLQRLSATLGDASRVLGNWGVGMSGLLGAAAAPRNATPDR